MRKTLSDKGVAALKARAQRYAYPDPELRGHWVRIFPSGRKSYYAVTRGPDGGKQIWTKTGDADMLIANSRAQAREILKRVRAGLPPVKSGGESFAAVAANWLKRHVDANGLRSASEIRRRLTAHVLPVWGERPFLSIRRSDVAALLDGIEDRVSPRQADATLTDISSLMHWFAARSDDYTPPIVRGMRRQSPSAQRRARVLTDDEIRAIWKAAESAGPFGAVVQMCLLTAQRRAKVLRMRHAELGDGIWTLPLEPREKGNAGALRLPPRAMAIVARQPRFVDNDFVFPGRRGPIIGVGKLKARLDQTSGTADWTLHDLRRTARSLMSRAGVPGDHAERVLGHAIGGVEGTYDRHSYAEEKGRALAKLAVLIEGIVHPRDNVTAMVNRKRR